MMSRSRLLFLLLLNIAFVACDKDETSSGANSTSSGGTGSIKGTVVLVDSVGNTIHDATGVRVSLEGTTFATNSASDGIWSMDNIPVGSYSIRFEKSGFSTMKRFGTHVLGGTSYTDSAILWEPINRTMKIDYITLFDAEYGLQAWLPPGGWKTYVACVSKDSASLLQGPNTELPYFLYSDAAIGLFGLGYQLPRSFQDFGISKGTVLYGAVYIVSIGADWASVPSYYDPDKRIMVYPSAGKVSNIVRCTWQ